MKKLPISLLISLFVPSFASAALTVSQMSSMGITLYGMYTSADPTCQTGLTATLPLSSSPMSEDLTTGPTLGTGPVSSSINCVVFVLKNTVNYGWSAGSYTSTTNGASDSVCNAGGTLAQKICDHGESISWPSQITQDAAAAGLSLTSTCGNGTATGNEIVPVFVSTYSACVGQASLDPSSCVSGGNNTNSAFAAPTATGDTAHGCKLTAPASGAASYTLVIDPAGSMGNNSGSCQSVAPPIFSLR